MSFNILKRTLGNTEVSGGSQQKIATQFHQFYLGHDQIQKRVCYYSAAFSTLFGAEICMWLLCFCLVALAICSDNKKMRSKYHTINWVQYLAKYGIANKNNPFFTTKKRFREEKRCTQREFYAIQTQMPALFSIDISYHNWTRAFLKIH